MRRRPGRPWCSCDGRARAPVSSLRGHPEAVAGLTGQSALHAQRLDAGVNVAGTHVADRAWHVVDEAEDAVRARQRLGRFGRLAGEHGLEESAAILLLVEPVERLD